MSPEYRHYYCQPCSQQQRAAIAANSTISSSIEMDWQSITDGKFECGEWSKDGMKFKGHGCCKPATMLLLSRGGTPIQYVRPK